MKRLILLLLLAACSYDHDHEYTHDHDHPVGDHSHQHRQLGHEDYSLWNLGLPYAYIMRVDPPQTQWGIPPIGVLTKTRGEGEYRHELVEIQFSRHPENYKIVDLELPWVDTTPIDTYGLESNLVHKANIVTDCADPDHTGYIAFRITWDTGAVDFVYKCPEEED